MNGGGVVFWVGWCYGWLFFTYIENYEMNGCPFVCLKFSSSLLMSF